jgi:N-lysine methyltransferase SETD6
MCSQWNTYGDPPNSDLLRRYGHVDLVPLPGRDVLGNPADIIEVRADLIIECMSLPDNQRQSIMERIDWWLEQGGDE